MTANKELQLRLSDTLASLATGVATADGLKDAWWLICHAMRAAIAELRQQEATPAHWTDERKEARLAASRKAPGQTQQPARQNVLPGIHSGEQGYGKFQ